MLAALVFLLAQAPAPGTGWELFAEDGEGRYFLESSSLRRVGDSAHFRMRAEGNGRVQQAAVVLMQMVIDCRLRTAAFQEGYTYDRQGNLLNSRRVELDQLEPYPINAGMGEEQMLSRVCR